MPTELRRIEGADGLAYELELGASPAVVWSFWTESEQIVRWRGDVAPNEPWPGGTFRVAYRNGEVAAGHVLDVEPPQFLAFTWGWEAAGTLTPPGTSRIEVILDPVSDGERTLLRFRHLNQQEAAVDDHDAGWRFFLPRLAEAVAAPRSSSP
jgi:uncharacterized protein YndB with AHSA1/START domain